jgi:hypothetical protein
MTDIVKKEKKVQTPERLEQLARARKKALEIRQAGAIIKMEAKIASITDPGFTPTPPNEIENKIQRAELVDNPVTQEFVPEYSPRVEVKPPVLNVNGNLLKQPHIVYADETETDEDDMTAKPPPMPPIIKKKKSGKGIKTKIVIEQSSDDEDEFHPHEHVIFVKRKSKNDSLSKAKVIPAVTEAPPTSPVRGNRNEIPIHPQQALRQMPSYPAGNTMDDFINAGFSNHRKYY